MYNIGQVIYIYKSSNDSLFPCIVCEEVVKKTLEGTNKYYKVLLPDSEGTVIDLSKMDVEVFSDLTEFKEEYISRAEKRVITSIGKCKEICDEKFKSFISKNSDQKNNEKENKQTKEKDKIIIKDENNVKLNIDISKLEELGL